MKRIWSSLAIVLLAASASQAATTSTTLTVTNATGSIGASITVSGTATLTNIGSGPFTATLAVSSLTSPTLAATFTIALSGGNLTGSLAIPATMLLTPPTGTAVATINVDGKSTGTYAGASGSFTSLTGNGSLVGTTFTLSLTGFGSITTGASTGGGTTTPTITKVQNNYSNILPGLPNYGIAPGSLFVVYGSNLNNQPLTALQDSSASGGLPKTLNGSSISVTVNGTTVQPAIYYTAPGQIAAVLPSNTPVGTGTITVTNSGQPSAAAPFQVVQSAPGLDTLYGTGSGAGVATVGANVFTTSNSAAPGQTVVLWGSGLGADTSNTDTTYPLNQNDLTSKIGLKVYIGGVEANVAYAGRSQYPGVDQIDVTIPAGVTPGCSVSVATVSGTPSIVSNSVTISVASNGGACSDSIFGISGTQAGSLSGKSSVNFGFLGVTQSTNVTSAGGGGTTNDAAAVFENVSGIQFGSTASSGVASLGSCVVNTPTLGSTPTAPTINGLDAGSITVTGPGGTVPLMSTGGLLGIYVAQLSSTAIPASGGAFTFTGSGGKSVGAFTVNLNFPAPLVWTNRSSIVAINRSQGVGVNWTGGSAGTYVQIAGSSIATIGGQITAVSFTCSAPASAGTFTVPPPVLLALPAGTGSLSLSGFSNPQTFTASGLDLGYAYAGALSSISTPYN